MRTPTQKRLMQLVEFHEKQDKHFPKKLSLELGNEHSEMLERLVIATGQTKTAVVRQLIEHFISTLQGGFLICDDPSRLLHAVESSEL
jgi:predicted DNA-binding protein